MKAHTAPYVAVMLIVLGTFSTVPRTPDPAVRVDSNAIGGVVTGPSGPEAGVWVIAETSEVTTKFVKSQAEWIRILKSGGCWACHQLGSRGTREIPKALGTFESSTAAWLRRLQSGQAGGQMIGTVSQLGAKRALAMFADWTDRIAAGAIPPTPPRPQGIERNVVITEWDWADPKAYLHDEVSTDRRNPTLNANGSIYGSLELSADYLPVLDPVRNTTSRLPLTVRDPNTEP